MGGFGFDPGQGNSRYSQGTPAQTKTEPAFQWGGFDDELARFLASLAPAPEAEPLPTETTGFGADERRIILDSMLKPEGNGKVTSKPDGTIQFDIRPDQSLWGDLDASTLQAFTDANNAASGNANNAPLGNASAFTGMGGDINAMALGAITNYDAGVVDDVPVVEKTPEQHADEYLTMLSKMDTDEDRIQFALDPMGDASVPGFLGADAATLLRTGVGGLGEPEGTSQYEWVDGKIQVKPKVDKPLVCDPGYHLENGKCVPDTAKTKQCDPGYHLENGVCVPDTAKTKQCDPGYHLENGVCVPDAAGAQMEECGVGQVRNAAGICVPEADTTKDDACPAGEVRDANGVCVPAAKTAPPACPAGQVRNAAGVCVPIAQTTAADACPAGQVRGINGECVSVYTAPTDFVAPPPPPPGTTPPPGDGSPTGTIETLSANPREIATAKLNETKTAITNMLNSGLLDIKTAQELYDTETERVWKDFLSTQNAVRSDFRNVTDAQRAQRYDDRTALEEQMRAAGVNPGLVGDRFAMIDAVAAAGAGERGAYLDDLGLVSQMAGADRKFMGEGIFGGYKQDLRSRARELGYGADVDKIGADYGARSQALQAADLAPFLGLDPRAVAAGLASGVDIPGLSTGISEAALDRALTTGESALDRKAQGIDPLTGRPYGFSTTTGLTGAQQATFDAQGINPATGRPYGFDTTTGLDAGQTATLTAQGINPATGLPYGFDTATGLTATEGVGQENFLLGLAGEGIDTRETITLPNGNKVANPGYGRPWGFDTRTGFTAAEQLAADQFDEKMVAAGIDPLTGLPYGFDTETGLTAADKVSAEQFTEQIASTEGIAADRLDFAKLGLDLDWWEARGDQAAGVMDRQLEKNQFELLEDKFALIEDQFAWDQAMDIAELGDQDFNLGTQLSLHAGSIEGGAAVMQEVADYMYNNNINADNTGYAHALAALDYGTVLTFLYTQQFMEDGTPQEVAEPLADAAVDALKETSGASAGPVADPADKVKTAAPIEQTTRERVFIDGTNNPKPQGNVRTLDTNKLVLEGFSGYRDAEGNYYENQWKAPSHDTGRTAVVDTTGDITGIPMGQYYVDDNGIIIDVQSGGNKSAINTKAPEGWDRR